MEKNGEEIISKMSGVFEEFDIGYMAVNNVLYTWQLDTKSSRDAPKYRNQFKNETIHAVSAVRVSPGLYDFEDRVVILVGTHDYTHVL